MIGRQPCSIRGWLSFGSVLSETENGWIGGLEAFQLVVRGEGEAKMKKRGEAREGLIFTGRGSGG